MAARKQKSSDSRPPARQKEKARKVDEDEDAVDSGWFDDEAPTQSKASSKPPAKPPSKRPSKAPAPASAAKAPAKSPPRATSPGASRAVDRLMPPNSRRTMEVQVEWLEESKTGSGDRHTIQVQPDWLEDVEEEPPTMPRGRKVPPPIPKPPPLPREVAADPPPARPKKR